MIFNDLYWLVMTFNYFVSKLCLDIYERGMFFFGGEKGGEATGKGGSMDICLFNLHFKVFCVH